jgi:O-methyltransferase involved in polyketide biosynthesis
MIDYKSSLLSDATPHCRLDPVAADLTDADARARIFAATGPRTLIITEGLLMYLPGDVVAAIISCGGRAGYWLVEMVSPDFARRIGMTACQAIEAVRASDCLDGAQTLELFHAAGWHTRQRRNYMGDVLASAPERVMALIQERSAQGGPPPPPPDPADISGVYLFEHL